MRRSPKCVLCICTLLVSLAIAGTPTASAAAQKPGRALKVLVKQTRQLPASKLKRRLLVNASFAQRRAKVAPCVSVRALNRYRHILQGVHVKAKGSKRARKRALKIASLTPVSLDASRALLRGKRTKRCGGGIAPSKVKHAKATVHSSSTKGMTVTVQLPDLHFVPKTGGGKSWTQLVLPDTDSPSKPGTPGVPVSSSQFAVPEGATVEVDPGDVQSYTLDGVDVYPAQPESVDAAAPNTKEPNFLKAPFASKPFTFDPKAYANTDPLPAADGGLLGHVRDLAIGNLVVPAVQFDPKQHKLNVLTSVDVKIKFGGKNSGKFDGELGSPWERAARSGFSDLLNRKLILGHLGDIIFRPCGEQMLVITNPATLAAANALATARNAAGLKTRVVQTGAGAGQIGTTTAQIQSYIRGQLTALLCIHPSYVTIMGDDDLVPTFAGIDSIPSDLPYSLRNDADELPDVAVGRIIGNDQTEVQQAVDKIVGYEAGPPSTGDFLRHATVAAQFQDDDNDGTENRTFVWFAETVRNGLVKRGVTVDRVYGESPGNNPQKLNDGTPLPASLLKPTFGWNGTGADVSADWNAGRFLMIHRDHGWSDGWGLPGFGTGDVNALTNGNLLPVLLSINCSSGAYDYDETSFAGSALTRTGGGAVGVFGDTRDSPSWHNSQIALGFVDALLPSVLPSEGPASAQRMGDALINGKVRLAGLANPATDGSSRDELYLWHYFGDPSMQMWGGGHAPFVIDPSKLLAQLAFVPIPKPGDPPYHVNVTLPEELNGQSISLLQNGLVVGEAIVKGGKASISPLFGDGSVKPGELKVAVEGDGAQPASAPVDTSAAKTTLAQQCPASGTTGQQMTVNGTLTGAPAGSTVTVTFQAPGGRGVGRTVVSDVTTNANGAWSASVTPTANEPGTWTISSAYAGDKTHFASNAGPCQVTVDFPPIP